MKRWALTDEELRLTRDRMQHWAAKASGALVAGVVTVAPLALTLWVLWLVLQVAAFAGGIITKRVLYPANYPLLKYFEQGAQAGRSGCRPRSMRNLWKTNLATPPLKHSPRICRT